MSATLSQEAVKMSLPPGATSTAAAASIGAMGELLRDDSRVAGEKAAAAPNVFEYIPDTSKASAAAARYNPFATTAYSSKLQTTREDINDSPLDGWCAYETFRGKTFAVPTHPLSARRTIYESHLPSSSDSIDGGISDKSSRKMNQNRTTSRSGGEGRLELPAQRLARLKSEVVALAEYVKAEAALGRGKDVEVAELLGEDPEEGAQRIEEELLHLKKILNALEDAVENEPSRGGQRGTETLALNTAKALRVLQSTVKSSAEPSPSSSPTVYEFYVPPTLPARESNSASPSSPADGSQMPPLAPPSSRASATSSTIRDSSYRLRESVDLERRLSVLETVMGVGNFTRAEGGGVVISDIQSSLEELRARLQYLDMTKLDVIGRRVQHLTQDLEAVVRAKRQRESAPLSDEDVQVRKLFSTCQEWQPVAAHLPLILERLQNLAALHTRGAEFEKRLEGLEKAADQTDQLLSTACEAVASVERHIAQATSTMEKNIELLTKLQGSSK